MSDNENFCQKNRMSKSVYQENHIGIGLYANYTQNRELLQVFYPCATSPLVWIRHFCSVNKRFVVRIKAVDFALRLILRLSILLCGSYLVYPVSLTTRYTLYVRFCFYGTKKHRQLEFIGVFMICIFKFIPVLGIELR